MSSKMSRNCSLVSKYVQKNDYICCPKFFHVQILSNFFRHEKFQTNFGQIKQTNSGHEKFQINYWTNSGYEKIFKEILDSILKFFTKKCKNIKTDIQNLYCQLKKNEEQAKILYMMLI